MSPLPHVFPQPPFPLEREPTASAPRGATLSTRIDCYRSLFMSLVRGRKESKLVRSLVLYVKLGIRFSRRLAARIPSFKSHIPFIRTLRICFRLSACVLCTLNTKQALARSCGLSFCPSHFESEECLRG